MEMAVKVSEWEGPVLRHGVIKYLVQNADYGLIESNDGRHVYFHCHSLVDAEFNRLQEGDRVVFSEKSERQFSRAMTVYLAGSHAVLEW